MGAAVIAAVAAGEHKDLPSACAALHFDTAEVENEQANSELYADAYRRYRLLFEGLEPMYASH